MRTKFVFLWITPVILGAFTLGLLFADQLRAREAETFWDDTVESRVRAIVGREYVDQIDEERGRELFYSAMEGYLKALDPYCSFYDPTERARMEEDTSGRFGGIGVLVEKVERGLKLIGLRRGDPAERAGAKLGDIISEVEGESVAGLEIREVTPKIKGPPGTDVTIAVLRGGERIPMTLTRSAIAIDSVVGVRMVDVGAGVGYLRVRSFKETTGAEARRALEKLLSMGAKSIVLDVRQNSGGVLENGAVALVDLFLTDGPIVQTRGRAHDSRRIYQASEDNTVCPDRPLVVLIDGGSASAAEVVAGAFQDRRRGILVGERTYGKFLVQSIHRLSGTDVALSLTTAKYYTPYGRWLQRKEDLRGRVLVRGGLMPDVLLTPPKEETDRLVNEYFRDLHGLDMQVVAEPEPVPDRQLERAVKLLVEFKEVKGN